MPKASIKLSNRAKALFDKGKLDRQFNDLAKQSGEWYLGRHAETKGNAPLDRGFGKSTLRVKNYPSYNGGYKSIRKKGGWLSQTGALLEYVREKTAVKFWPRGFKLITPVKPSGKGPAAYAGIHQHGGEIQKTKKMTSFFWWKFKDTGKDFWKYMALAKGPFEIPKREYLAWDDSDTKRWRVFATKWLNVHLGFGKSQI